MVLPYKVGTLPYKVGIPTGGGASVPLANIAVYFVLKNAIYADQNKMKNIISIKRFIDDGVRMHQMSNREYDVWRKNLTKRS